MNLKQLFSAMGGNTQRVCDMAIPQKRYEDKCINMLDPALTHVAKICVFPNGNIDHWKNELFSFIYPLFEFTLKKDDKRNTTRSRSFADNFVYALFDEDFSSYNKIKAFFEIAIRREGHKSKGFNIDKLVEDNKDRIIGFLKNLLLIPHNLDDDATKELLDKYIDEFADQA